MRIKYLRYYREKYKEMNDIAFIIQGFLKQECVGKENAVKIKELHWFVKLFDPEISERDMRREYEFLDKCWCRGGLYYPKKEEVEKEQDKIEGTISHFAKKKKILEELKERLEPVQGRLW